MAYALGLATLASTLTAGFINYVRVARASEARLMADIRLESAASEVLGRLAETGLVAEANALTNDVTILIQSPLAQVDPTMDGEDGVGSDIAALLGREIPLEEMADQEGLVMASRAHRLSAREEDCLRRHVTYGRAPAERYPGLEPERISAGEQVDLRLALQSGNRDEVLWVRARLTGDEHGWQLHDYRRLSGAATCDG
jgi:hypothetical protein